MSSRSATPNAALFRGKEAAIGIPGKLGRAAMQGGSSRGAYYDLGKQVFSGRAGQKRLPGKRGRANILQGSC